MGSDCRDQISGLRSLDATGWSEGSKQQPARSRRQQHLAERIGNSYPLFTVCLYQFAMLMNRAGAEPGAMRLDDVDQETKRTPALHR